MAVAAVVAFSISPLSASPDSGAAVTDTHTSVRVTATVAPEHLRAAVSERALESFAPLDSREWLPEAPGKRWADGTRPSASLPDAFAAEFQSRPETHAELQLAAGTASGSRGRCRSARVGLAWYRQRQRDWLTLRWRTHNSLAFMSFGRAPRSCADARFLAQVAKRRSFAARQAYGRWLERQRTLRNRVPVGEAELRAYINDDCLEEIIDRESAGTWSPTVRNYTDGIAYGLPQARPGYKMASAGSDWETNSKTQIAWMRSYVNGRYGGSCGALAHHNANGWY